ncbi:LacI family DNA-binding transcriptional regulator [Colwellia sp. 20A7]|uniref:LacI family DNA-binding transcriptional regulator n=1 Tax=Colwellia sp. 20A7 TaxID=2689569 RepID=UPI00135B0118|nr:LacI family DNA-binding transcriptional regulator [Colwellia sp. 20A7]
MQSDSKKIKNGKHATTIYDVAQFAGVSAMTVSRVVNNSGRVSDKTRKKISDAILELNYIPNMAARAARTGVQKIGVLFNNPKSSNLGGFLMGAFSAASKLGCELVIEPLSGHEEPLNALRALIDKGVGGVILPPPICDMLEAHQLARKHSVIALSFASGNPKLHSPAVLIDDYSAASAMTHYLLELGHKDIAFVKGDEDHSPANSRLEGFMVAMSEAGLEVNNKLVFEGDFSYKSGLDAAHKLLEPGPSDIRPTAIFAANDEMATAIVAVAHGLNIKIPEEISIVGFDDSPAATAIWPQLTTIYEPLEEMAFEAVQILDKLLREGDSISPGYNHYVAQFKLIERASSAHCLVK